MEHHPNEEDPKEHRPNKELDRDHAVTRFPSPDPHATPSTGEEAPSNGQVSETPPVQATEQEATPAPVTPPTPVTPSPLLEPYHDTAAFWHLPLDKEVFHDTPLLVNQRLADAERVVIQMESYLRYAGYEVEAGELRMNYTQWVKIPATQYELLRHELEPRRQKYTEELEQVQRDIEKAQAEFIETMAQAKISIPEPPKPKKRSKVPPAPEPISPRLVERALQNDFTSDDEVCGEQGVAPVSSRGSVWNTVGQWIFELAAPLAAGLLLGVNLGVIVGLLSLKVIQRGESLWLVVLAAIIGLFVEKLVGNTAYSLASSAAQASEQRDALDTKKPFPSMRSVWRLAFFIIVIVMLTIAIATVDALGLLMLYEERRSEVQLFGALESAAVPIWLFFIAGLIISAPYIVYKSVKGWREPEIRQREARIAYLRQKHVEQRRGELAVQSAFVKAQVVQNLYERRNWLTQQLEQIVTRLDSARTECIGSTQRFRDYWDSLVEQLRRERAPYALDGIRRDGRFHSRRPQGETFLQRIKGLFQR